MAGRRRRAKACLKAVQEDSQLVLKKMDTTKDKKKDLQTEVETLNKRLEQLKKDLAAMESEETSMKDRVALRLVQAKALTQRLEEGWNDEQEAATLQ
jgi:outer membrane murein-binding lipoprotein Lpp